MATELRNNNYQYIDLQDAQELKIAVVVSEWNNEITDNLKNAAVSTLLNHNLKETNIIVKYVPGSFELPLGAKLFIENTDVDAVICLGCVIQGETRHFDFVCQGVTQGIMELNIKTGIPVIFGVLTTNNQIQAKDRAGGILGNKGEEAAIAALKMIKLKNEVI